MGKSLKLSALASLFGVRMKKDNISAASSVPVTEHVFVESCYSSGKCKFHSSICSSGETSPEYHHWLGGSLLCKQVSVLLTENCHYSTTKLTSTIRYSGMSTLTSTQGKFFLCGSHCIGEIENPLPQHARLLSDGVTAEPGGWNSPLLGTTWIQVEEERVSKHILVLVSGSYKSHLSYCRSLVLLKFSYS